MEQKSHFTQKAIKDLIAILEDCGAIERIRESWMQGILEDAIKRVATTAIDDCRKAMERLNYELALQNPTPLYLMANIL